ncbi:GNAT family N-acetyltransferase [Streptomyces beihaiensis]|uniref:GNAT family N-acetyltransferase n=1 Tax=Streptomyces beihaiensis TaxID=2984495 RepID=A0ABT3TUS6_9ACTN|nr:GNAT family N-acetyltransferase [Streptomyces beihaiensis]MCX3060271.1 GNAT family N-acetyltransferase [Streptomyces beihaiensis]
MQLLTIPAPRLRLHELSHEAAAGLSLEGGTGGFTWLGGGPNGGTRVGAGTAARMRREGTYRPGWGAYVVVRAEDGRALGGIGWHSAPDARGLVEIGYDLVPPARGAGYATEAADALTTWALAQSGVTAVIARTDPDNTASQRVLERAGFVRRDDGTASAGPDVLFTRSGPRVAPSGGAIPPR